MRIEAILDLSQLTDSVREQWQQLPLPSPMQSPTWLLNWWTHMGRQPHRQLCLLAGLDGPQLVGLAPCYLQRSLDGNCLRLLGDGLACSDHSGLLAKAGSAEPVRDALSNWLVEHAGRDWHWLKWEAVDAADQLTSDLMRQLVDAGCDLHVRETTGCWSVELPDNLDSLLAQLSKNHRKRCRRWFRKYFETGLAEVRRSTPATLQDNWHTLAELNAQRREVLGDRSAFADPGFHHFHLALLPSIIAGGLAEMRELAVEDEVVATEYVLLDAGTMYCYQSGMVTSQGPDGYGNLSILALFHDAIERGFRRIDFLRGDEDYKQHWGASRQACVHYCLGSRSLPGAARLTYQRTLDWMRSVKVSLCGLSPLAGTP